MSSLKKPNGVNHLGTHAGIPIGYLKVCLNVVLSITKKKREKALSVIFENLKVKREKKKTCPLLFLPTCLNI